MKGADNGDGRKGNSQAEESGQVGDLSREPEDEVSNPRGAGVLALQQRNHRVTALSQEESSDEIRCHQLKQATSC